MTILSTLPELVLLSFLPLPKKHFRLVHASPWAWLVGLRVFTTFWRRISCDEPICFAAALAPSFLLAVALNALFCRRSFFATLAKSSGFIAFDVLEDGDDVPIFRGSSAEIRVGEARVGGSFGVKLGVAETERLLGIGTRIGDVLFEA